MNERVDEIISQLYKIMEAMSCLYGNGADPLVFAAEHSLKLAIDLLVSTKGRRYLFHRAGAIKMKLRRIRIQVNRLLVPTKEEERRAEQILREVLI